MLGNAGRGIEKKNGALLNMAARFWCGRFCGGRRQGDEARKAASGPIEKKPGPLRQSSKIATPTLLATPKAIIRTQLKKHRKEAADDWDETLSFEKQAVVARAAAPDPAAAAASARPLGFLVLPDAPTGESVVSSEALGDDVDTPASLARPRDDDDPELCATAELWCQRWPAMQKRAPSLYSDIASSCDGEGADAPTPTRAEPVEPWLPRDDDDAPDGPESPSSDGDGDDGDGGGGGGGGTVRTVFADSNLDARPDGVDCPLILSRPHAGEDQPVDHDLDLDLRASPPGK